MFKKIVLALLILVLIVFLAFTFTVNNSVDIYLDGENVSVTTHTLSNIDTDSLNREICDYTIDIMNDTSSNVTTLKNKVSTVCSDYGLEDIEVNVNSILGENQIPVLVYVEGTSMVPTLQDGQTAIYNKTHDIHVGDIVVADSDEYGGIVKRVADIRGDSVYLISDNKEISYEYINGQLYEIQGIRTWVDISDINGVVIYY
ncbi:S24 family peptidase [Methanobrevibacter sp.]